VTTCHSNQPHFDFTWDVYRYSSAIFLTLKIATDSSQLANLVIGHTLDNY